MAFERSQLKRQLVRSVRELAQTLRQAGLRIVAVEKPIDVAWRGGKLVGRIDLLVETEAGTRAIIDVKWGRSSYRDVLRGGQALQLAVYTFAQATDDTEGAMPEASYFSLKQSKLFGLSSQVLPTAEVITGPTLEQTWSKVERSIDPVERTVGAGRFPVTGLRRSLPLLESLDIPEAERPSHFALSPQISCRYCGLDTMCGRRWEAFQ
jgi:hypothetical protein